MMEESEGTKSPGAVRTVWKWWKRVARRIGDIQARVLLIFFYFVLLGPFALAVRWGSDPLMIKTGTPRDWCPRADKDGTPMESARRQS